MSSGYTKKNIEGFVPHSSHTATVIGAKAVVVIDDVHENLVPEQESHSHPLLEHESVLPSHQTAAQPTIPAPSATPESTQKKLPPRFAHEIQSEEIAPFVEPEPVLAPSFTAPSAPVVLPKPPRLSAPIFHHQAPVAVHQPRSIPTVAEVQDIVAEPEPGDFSRFLHSSTKAVPEAIPPVDTAPPPEIVPSPARQYFDRIVDTYQRPLTASTPPPFVPQSEPKPVAEQHIPEQITEQEPAYEVAPVHSELFAPKKQLLTLLKDKIGTIHETRDSSQATFDPEPPTFDVATLSADVLEMPRAAQNPIFTADLQPFLNYNDLTDAPQNAPSSLQTHLLARKKELSQLRQKETSSLVLGAEAVEPEQREKYRHLKTIRLFFKIFLLVILIALMGAGLYIMFVHPSQKTASRGVEAAFENSTAQQRDEFDTWAKGYFGNTVKPEDDADTDGLTNWEEFLLGSNPTKFSNCENKLSDAQSLFHEIDPGSCQRIDAQDTAVRAKYNRIIDFVALENSLARPIKNMTLKEQPLSQLFNIADISKIDFSNDVMLIASQEELLVKKQRYVVQMRAIAEYVNTYRSYGPFDRNVAAPVHPAVYVDTAIKYRVPLKYVMALSKITSKFGTDAYTDAGAPVAMFAHKNMYALGGSASAGLQSFDTWEAGVDAFGQWYSFTDEKSLVGCAKWEIFSTSADFCNIVEAEASKFETILKQ